MAKIFTKGIALVFLNLFCWGVFHVYAQDDLLSDLEVLDPTEEKPTVGEVFNGTRLVNTHSTEMLSKNHLEFRVAHRFGEVNQGLSRLYGLDFAGAIQLSFDYAVEDWLTLGLGRTNSDQVIHGLFKARLMEQRPASAGFAPVNIVWVSMMNVTHREERFANEFRNGSNRLEYFNQLLLSWKASNRLSALASAYFHRRNLVAFSQDNPNTLGGTLGGRFKFNSVFSINAELLSPVTYASASAERGGPVPLSLGLDIETGGHVFQVFFTTSAFVNEAQVHTQPAGSVLDGGYRLGFNVSRVFGL